MIHVLRNEVLLILIEMLTFFTQKIYQWDFLFRNYGIFVLPAVVHFEDGVPNIYEG